MSHPMSDTSRNSRTVMQEGISNLAEAHDELTDLLNDLDSELSTSLGQWEENAHNAYIEVQRSWDASAARQQEIVQHMPELLSNTPDGGGATESRTAGIWG